MTPKEKAIVLIDMFFEYTNDADKYEYAKKCAIITVNEILKQVDELSNEYWQEVKQEINKL